MGNIDQYRQALLAQGFEEATEMPLRFWKVLTDKTAFIVNLRDLPNGIGVVYGVISTTVFWTDEDWDFFRTVGQEDDFINLRCGLEIREEADEAAARNAITELYREYLQKDKDALLAAVKEKRKQFLQQIATVLKPLGFRKKGSQWRKQLSDHITLQFLADKSSYCDSYYFEVDVFSTESPIGPGCYFRRMEIGGDNRFDWQLRSTEELLAIVHQACEQELKPFLENNLTVMGKSPSVWAGCICQRTRCKNCWIEKNLWEAKEVSNT